MEDKTSVIKPGIGRRINSYLDKIPKRYDNLIAASIISAFYGFSMLSGMYNAKKQEKQELITQEIGDIFHNHGSICISDVFKHGCMPPSAYKTHPKAEKTKPKTTGLKYPSLLEEYETPKMSLHFMRKEESLEDVCSNKLKSAGIEPEQPRIKACVRVVEVKNKDARGSRLLYFPIFKK